MYIYKNAIGALLNHITGVQFIDLSAAIMKDTIHDYRVLWIVCADEIYKKDVSINLMQYQHELSVYDGTIQDWLDSLSNRELNTTNTLPPDDYLYARFEDLQMCGYVPYPARYEYSISQQAYLTMKGAEDIRLKHPSVRDYDKIARTCLFTYNGHFIRAVGTNDGLYLLGAGNNHRVNSVGGYGCWSFANLSNVYTHGFKEEDITVSQDGYGWSIYVNVKEDLTHHLCWLVLGGKLLVDPYLIQRVDDHTIKINVESMLVAYKGFESTSYIDLSDVVGLPEGILKCTQKNIITFITQLLLNSNSFYVMFDNPYMGISVEPLESYIYPTTFVSKSEHSHALQLSNGMFPVWRTRPGIGSKLLDIAGGTTPNYLAKTYGARKPSMTLHDVTDHGNPRSMVKGAHFKVYSLLRIKEDE